MDFLIICILKCIKQRQGEVDENQIFFNIYNIFFNRMF